MHEALLSLVLAVALPRASVNGAAIVNALRSDLRTLASKDEFSGAVLLAKGGRTLFSAAYGYADRSFDVKNAVDTKFNLGSMGKMFTGVAVLQLAQAGKLSLDDRLIRDLPGYPNREVANRVTIRQLLTHTSGLGDFFGPEFASANMSRFNTLESLLPLFVEKPLLFAPGSQWQYSNAGYIVLGLVIQHVSGESYYDYVRNHIFDVAGMHDTGNWPADAVVPNRAVGYTTMGTSGATRISNVCMLQRGGSAGGGYSTVGDLLRFADALQGGKLLNAEYTRVALSGQVDTKTTGVRYGFGMVERILNGTRIVGHSGGGPGIESVLDIYPESGYVVTILTNYDHAMAAVDDKLRTALTGQATPAPVAASADTLSAYAGKYKPVVPAEMHMTPPPIVVTVASGGLLIDPGMGPAYRFSPVGSDEFVGATDPTLRVRFVRNSQGGVIRLDTTTGFGPVPPISADKVP